jgi:hypothetical protein
MDTDPMERLSSRTPRAPSSLQQKAWTLNPKRFAPACSRAVKGGKREQDVPVSVGLYLTWQRERPDASARNARQHPSHSGGESFWGC